MDLCRPKEWCFVVFVAWSYMSEKKTAAALAGQRVCSGTECIEGAYSALDFVSDVIDVV